MKALGVITYDTHHLTPIFLSDTLETLSRRHYENKMHVLSNFEFCLRHPQNPLQDIPHGRSRRRMKAEQKQDLSRRFKLYKQQLLSSRRSTIEGQTSHSPQAFRKSLIRKNTLRDLRKEAS